MNQHLKLEEIIWEITGECKNKCKFCGSKDMWKKPTDEKVIIKIAEQIAKYPPTSINISGGDPLLVDIKTHQKIIDILKRVHVNCKIIVNPRSFKVDGADWVNILTLYDWMGISINNDEDLKAYEKYHQCLIFNKTTIISNFNLANLFIFNKIKDFVVKNKLTWQIQFTMFEDEDNDLAIYNNDEALTVFFDNISEAKSKGAKIICADNMNNGTCSAGKNSLGILSNGDVVPCLSMRAWKDNVNTVVVGNLWSENGNWRIADKLIYEEFAKNPLQYIWEKRFNNYRFKDFKCCKDHCKNKCIKFENTLDWLKKDLKKHIPYPQEPGDDHIGPWKILPPDDKTKPLDDNAIYVYGVTEPTRTILYGVHDFGKKLVYGVGVDKDVFEPFTTSTSTTHTLDEKIDPYSDKDLYSEEKRLKDEYKKKYKKKD